MRVWKGRSPVRFVSAKKIEPRNRGTPVPTISAGALKRMPVLPANVVAGVPRVEKDPRGGDVVIVPVRPYARDMDRCARCGERGRPYDRLGVRRWRHLDIGCARLLLEHAPRRVDCAEHGVTVAMVLWRDARARTRVTSSGRSHG